MKNILLSFVLLAVVSCSNTKNYRVQFDDVDWLKYGDKVVMNGLEVGQVQDLSIDEEQKVLVEVQIRGDITLPKGSIFKIKSSLLGNRYVEVDLGKSSEPLNTSEIQKGYLQPPDTTGFRKLSAAQKDSMIKANPIYGLADHLLKKIKERDSATIKK